MLTLHVLSAVRAYVGGESLWSKGQKDASCHLLRCSESFDSTELARLQAAIAVPLGDRIGADMHRSRVAEPPVFKRTTAQPQ